jgi:cysteine desulfurase
VGSTPSATVFTSGATEANNAAILSAITEDSNKKHLVTSGTEHSSVIEYCKWLSQRGYEITFCKTSENGTVDLDHLQSCIRPDTAVVSIMWANNETGVISPVQDIAKLCSKNGVRFHCDAVQAVGKIPIDLKELSIDFLTLSGHKIGAAKGVGALILRDDVPFTSMIIGGKQEEGRRGGTESVPLIVGLGVACSIASNRPPTEYSRVASLRDHLEEKLISELPGAYVNAKDSSRLPNTSNFGIQGIDSEILVTFLDQHGICVSSGSACTEQTISPSHVILAMTGSHERASEAIRISLGLETTEVGLDRMFSILPEFVSLTQSLHPSKDLLSSQS